ncbi:MAG: glycosyltransferase family 1 protein [Proteobacteria bacterium]|nr:glycosyltransferase family 1 protein [Pseudomonadota bacterium]
MKKLNIAILSYRSAPFGGGQGIYVHDISKALSLMGHQVDVISGPPYPNLDEKVNLIKLPGLDLFQTFSFKDRLNIFIKKKHKRAIDFFEFFSTFFGGFPEMRTFGERAKEFLDTNYHYDIVIDNQSISYGMLKIQKKFPLIEIIHHPITKDYKFELQSNNGFMYRLSRHRWYSFLKMQKRVAPQLKTIVTPSINSLKDIASDFNVSKKNINVINNGLDIDIFIPYKEIERNPFKLITTASADVALKGLDYSLKSLASLVNDFPEISLLVIGKMKKGGHTSRLIDELGIKDKVSFKTGLTGFGYPVIEAMSCEVPLIATNVSSIPELVGDYAKLIPAKNTNELSNAIRSILHDYSHYTNIAVRGRQHIVDKFNWLKITEEYENIISKTINDFHKC